MGWFIKTPEERQKADKERRRVKELFANLNLEYDTSIVNNQLLGNQYGILQASSTEALSRLVNIAIGQGYRPVGSIACQEESFMHYFHQPVERITEFG